MGKLNGQITLVTGGNSGIRGVKVSTNPQRTQDKKYVIEQEDKKAAGKQFM